MTEFQPDRVKPFQGVESFINNLNNRRLSVCIVKKAEPIGPNDSRDVKDFLKIHKKIEKIATFRAWNSYKLKLFRKGGYKT